MSQGAINTLLLGKAGNVSSAELEGKRTFKSSCHSEGPARTATALVLDGRDVSTPGVVNSVGLGVQASSVTLGLAHGELGNLLSHFVVVVPETHPAFFLLLGHGGEFVMLESESLRVGVAVGFGVDIPDQLVRLVVELLLLFIDGRVLNPLVPLGAVLLELSVLLQRWLACWGSKDSSGETRNGESLLHLNCW